MAVSCKQSVLFCALLFFYVLALVGAAPAEEPPTYLPHQRRALENPRLPKRQNASSYEIQRAQKIVADAIAAQGEYNTYRFDHPQRNTYISRHSDGAASTHRKRDNAPAAPSLNATLLAAASLLSEHHAAAQNANGTLHKIYAQPKTLQRTDESSGNKKRAAADYWVSKITHTGHAPMGHDNSYMVYRDVTNPIFAGGAKGDGLHDDTAAINAAIAYQSNCGANCLSSTTKGTLIYFPPGTYLISTPINAYYYSQLVGDANNMPIIKTSPQFIGLGAIQSDVYYTNGNGGEWYIEQSNFYRQVRNFMIDITETTTAKVAGLHWQIAQATSLTNVFIYASEAAGTTQMGIFTENGSGGFMSDCYIQGGQYGIYGGNQQYTVREFELSSQTTSAICLLWDWGWTWSGMRISSTPIGITLINPEAPSGQQAGSIYLMDSEFDGVDIAIKANFMQKTILETSIITLDNIGVLKVNQMVVFTNNEVLAIPTANIDFIIIGNAELSGSSQGFFSVPVQLPPPSLQGPSFTYYREAYLVKSRPQYEKLTVADIVSVKDHGAKGDGVTDDTAAIAAALKLATTSNLIYFPAGSYIVTSTIVIPPNARITGEVWSQLVASGTYFGSMSNPKPMIQVGSVGDVGTVEISDMLFTSIGALPGLVMVEWNVAAASPGSVGMWDAHFRVGGAYGTKLQVAQCPKGAPIQTGCIAATMMMHITPSSDGYFENVWAWVADHDIDDATNTQITVAVARGILIESANGPTWFYGTASEHSILYQYNFFNTTNSFAGMIQTESPYFQYTAATESPGPFNNSIGLYSGDPIFPDATCHATDLLCRFSWAVMISDVTNLTIAGAGLYSWFDNYDQSVCVDAQNCQQRLINDGGYNSGLYIWNLITIGAVEMISDTATGAIILAKNNTQAIAHPFWSALGAYLDDYTNEVLSCDWDDTDPACLQAPLCDTSLTFATIDDLAAAAGTFPDACTDGYALGVLSNTLNANIANYSAVNSGYDTVFGDYVTYTKEMVPQVLQNFMRDASPSNPSGGPGNKYFECTYTEGDSSTTQQCPFPWDGLVFSYIYSMEYKLINSTGFYNDLSTNYGINSSWVKFGNSAIVVNCGGGGGGSEGGGPGHGGISCTRTNIQNIGIPLAADTINVPNPKDVISKALPTIAALQNTIAARQMDNTLGAWSGPTDDLLQTISMPVFMISQALESMAQVKSIGEKEVSQKKVDLILEILGIVLIFVPFLDDLVPELEVLDGVFNIISEVGNVALTIQSIVADPQSAPMDILGLLTAGGTRSESDFAKMGATRRGISDTVLGKIGAVFKKEDSKFQSTIKRKCFI